MLMRSAITRCRSEDADRSGTLNGLAHVHHDWSIEAGAEGGPVASHALQAFRGYGWPAIQAALDNPGYPPDPAVPSNPLPRRSSDAQRDLFDGRLT